MAIPISVKSVPLDNPSAAIREICEEVLPGWKGAREVELVVISGGITNLLYGVRPQAPLKPVLVRVYGEYTEEMIDRELEIKRINVLSKHGFGAEVLAKFANGRIETFLESRPLEPNEMGHPAMVSKIATRLADFHNVDLDEEKVPQLTNFLQSWLDKIEGMKFEDPKRQEFYSKNFDIQKLRSDVAELKVILKSNTNPIVFSHNDLLSGNVLLLKTGDEPISIETSPITIIDFEYGSYSYRSFDFGNHFNEYAGFDGSFEEEYPSQEIQRNFFEAYLEASKGQPNIADNPTVESLIEEATYFAVLSHLYWGVWGLIQARYSAIDFDFLSYSNSRISQYIKGRHIVFNA